MTVLDRKLRRDLSAAKGLLITIIGIIAIGVACFVAMRTSLLNLQLGLASYYAECRMADFWVTVKKLPTTDLSLLDNISGIAELRTRISFPVTVDLEEIDKPISGQVISLPAEPAPVINNILLKRGSYFTNRDANEVIVNDSFARTHRIGPGDHLHLILNNRRQELIVVGTAISSEFVYLLGPGGLIPDPENYGVFYVKTSFAEEVFDFQGAANQIVGLLTPNGRIHPDAILDEIERRLDAYGVVATTPRSRQSSHVFLTSEIRGLRVNAIILPMVFLSVAALILNVLMMRTTEQQRTVIGTLKAIGYSNRQLLNHFLKFGLFIGLGGGLLGVVVGYLLAGGMTTIYRKFYEFPNLVNRVYPALFLTGLGISLLFAVLGTLRGVRAVARLTPAQAMRPKPPRSGHRILLERWTSFWRSLDFRWQMVLRGIARNRTRTATSIAAGAAGAALLLATFQMHDAMLELLSFQFEKVLQSDFDVMLKNERDYLALWELRRLPGVDDVEPVLNVAGTFRNGHHKKQGAISGLLPHARLQSPRDSSGRRVPIPTVGVILTRRLADELGVARGDTLAFEQSKGLKNKVNLLVAEVIDSYLGMAAYADFHYMNRLVGEVDAANSFQLKLDPDAERTREFYRAVKQLPAIESVNSIRDNKARIQEVLVQQMMISITVVVSFAGLLFFGSILNSSLIGLSERRQEIATLRVLGYTPREIGAIFLRENFCLNLVGSILGLPLGYWLSSQFARMTDNEIFRFPMVIQPESWVLPVALGMLFTGLAHLPVQRAISKLNWLDVLNVRE